MERSEIIEKLNKLEETIEQYKKEADTHTRPVDLKYNLYGEYSDDIDLGDVSSFPEEIRQSLSDTFDGYNYARRKAEAEYGLIIDRSVNAPRTKIERKRKIKNSKAKIRNILAAILIAAGFLGAIKLGKDFIEEWQIDAKLEKKLKEYENEFIKYVIEHHKDIVLVDGEDRGDVIYDYKGIAEDLYTFGEGRFDTNLYMLTKVFDTNQVDRVLDYTEYKSMRKYLGTAYFFKNEEVLEDELKYQKALKDFGRYEHNMFNLLYGEDFEERKTL